MDTSFGTLPLKCDPDCDRWMDGINPDDDNDDQGYHWRRKKERKPKGIRISANLNESPKEMRTLTTSHGLLLLNLLLNFLEMKFFLKTYKAWASR